MSKKIISLILFFNLFLTYPVYAINILSTGKGIEVDNDGLGKAVVVNPNSKVVVVRAYPSETCSDTVKVFPRLFSLESQERQVVRVLVKQKISDCRINFAFEDKTEDKESKDNIVKTRFILSIPVVWN